MIPELDLGVVLLTNGSSSAARSTVMNTIVRSFMPVEQVDWIQMVLDEQEAEQQVDTIKNDKPAKAPSTTAHADLSQLTGRYRDPWFGDITIRLKDGHLVFSAIKSPKLLGQMRHLEGDRFMVRWIDRTLEADAYVLFERDRNDRVTSISMTKADDGDYDFEDLDLKRVE
jgi:hypothetical protein